MERPGGWHMLGDIHVTPFSGETMGQSHVGEVHSPAPAHFATL